MNSAQDSFIRRQLRLSGLLIMVGVAVEGITLLWNHPLSFVAFIAVSGISISAGVVLFLLALVSSKAGSPSD
jgi:energy-converting hydrogenase Eha subunit E